MRTKRQALAESKAAHNHPTYATMAFVMGCGVQGAGAGSHVYDENGKAYLALFDQYGNQSFGFSNDRIVDAIRDQLTISRLNSTKIMFEEEQILLTERLAGLTGNRLPYAYLANSGGETIDNALKLARAATGRPKFISALGCFHGKTFAALSASGRDEHARLYRPFLEQFERVPFGDVTAMEDALDADTAAVLLEPVQAEAGVIVPPPGYLREVRRLCSQAGALLILDEMQTAFGRLGTFFAFDQFGVTPDLVCIGKAFGGGVLPISAVLGTAEIWKSLKETPSTFGSSLGGNPLSCRVGLESIAIASSEPFVRAVKVSAQLLDQRLNAAAERFPRAIREHRGVGMMHGLEFHNESLAGLALGLLLERQVTSTYCLYNNTVLRVQPPMVISTDHLEDGLARLEDVLAIVDAQADRPATDRSRQVPPVRLTVPVKHPARRTVGLLHAKPYLLDPFALHNDQELPPTVSTDFAGTLGDDAVVWCDGVNTVDDGVVLTAQPCWLWKRLRRSFLVRPGAANDGCSLEIDIDWDTGSGPYEEILSGRIAFFVDKRLNDVLSNVNMVVDLPSRPEAQNLDR